MTNLLLSLRIILKHKSFPMQTECQNREQKFNMTKRKVYQTKYKSENFVSQNTKKKIFYCFSFSVFLGFQPKFISF